MKFAVCVLSLGYTRLAGITLYDSVTREFVETTPRVARELIEKGMVKGVKWKDDGFVPDPEFNMNDILVKSGVGKYRPLINDLPGAPVNSTYTLVRVLETNKGRLYEIISNKCQRVKITENKLKGLCAIGSVGGVFIENDEVKVCDGVVIQSRVYPEEVILGKDEAVVGGNEQVINDEVHEEVEQPQAEESGEAESEKAEPQSLEEVFGAVSEEPEETKKADDKKKKTNQTTSKRKK